MNHRRMILRLGFFFLGYEYYNVIFWCKESVANFDCVVYVSLFDFIEVGFLGNAFIFTIAIIFCIAFLKAFSKWNIGGRWFRFLYRYFVFRRAFVALILSVGVSFCWLSAYIGLSSLIRYRSWCRLSEISYARIYDGVIVLWDRFSAYS